MKKQDIIYPASLRSVFSSSVEERSLLSCHLQKTEKVCAPSALYSSRLSQTGQVQSSSIFGDKFNYQYKHKYMYKFKYKCKYKYKEKYKFKYKYYSICIKGFRE